MNSKGGEERPAVGDDEPVAAGMDDDEQFDCETLVWFKMDEYDAGFYVQNEQDIGEAISPGLDVIVLIL